MALISNDVYTERRGKSKDIVLSRCNTSISGRFKISSFLQRATGMKDSVTSILLKEVERKAIWSRKTMQYF